MSVYLFKHLMLKWFLIKWFLIKKACNSKSFLNFRLSSTRLLLKVS